MNNFQGIGQARIALSALAGWSAVFLLALALSLQAEKTAVVELAKIQCASEFRKDLIYRRWNAMNSPLYAAVSDITQPSEYLKHLPERDIVTPSGRRLTVINPAYMIRQVHELGDTEGIHAHMTSLNPIRPGNAPDDWERKALLKIEESAEVQYEILDYHDTEHLRALLPLKTEKPCLKCHGQQGYKEGDIRGGLALAVETGPVKAVIGREMAKYRIMGLFVWFIGVLSIGAGHMAIKRNLRELLSSRESLTKLSLAVENSSAAVMITDKTGRIEYINPKFTEVTGYGREEALGRNPRILNAGVHSREYYRDFWQTLNAGREWEGEFCNRKKNGEMYWAKALISPMRNKEGAITNFVAVTEDVTERKKTAEELKRALEAAEEASRTKSMFLANMSHEIRTPLNAIIGFSDLAINSELSPKVRGYTTKVREAGVILLGIINDILDISKIEAGKMDLEQSLFSLDDVLSKALFAVEPQARAKHLRLHLSLEPETPDSLMGDPLRLGQILTNLLSNAVKFTERGEIILSVGLFETKGSKVKLRYAVKDTGIGLSEEQLSKLFKPFTQADGSTTRRFGGTGLGLSISKQFVEIMGGELKVESEPGKGSTFSFTAVFGASAKGEQKVYPEKLNGLNVLVADNDPTSLDSTMKLLKKLSFAAHAVSTGEEALKELALRDRHHPYDILIMECDMPGMDGLETIARIKEDAALTSKPKVILTSAFCTEEKKERALREKILHFLQKPFTASVLFDSMAGMAGTEEESGDKESLPEPASGSAPAAGKKLFDLEGVRVLLAEDNPTNQLLAKELLKRTGAQITLANNGREAVEKVCEGNQVFDVILMDIQMPEMDGFEAARTIRGDSRFHGLPIIALTAHALEEERQKSLDAGMNDHITKPIKPMELFNAIASQLKLSGKK